MALSLCYPNLRFRFAREIGDAIAKLREEDGHRVGLNLDDSGMAAEKGVNMVSGASYAKYIRNRSPTNFAEELIGIRDKYQELSDACVVRGDSAFFCRYVKYYYPPIAWRFHVISHNPH